ncbi:MAG: protein kinase [Planctomycetia bacterium]|nr:protein kinase [Planctomycetia bacterium]
MAPVEQQLNELLVRWQELTEQGQSVTAEDLCPTSPDLASALRDRIEDLKSRTLSLARQIRPPMPPPELTVDAQPTARDLGPSKFPRVANYEILGVLGSGGMGVVYKARQTSLNRIVALKTILTGAIGNTVALARFRQEAEAVARLQHPNIVQIYEVGEAQGQPFFSLEFVDGGSLDKRLNGTPLAARQAAQLLETLARAIEAAHQRGVIHRDLKPANVLLALDSQVPLPASDSKDFSHLATVHMPLATAVPKITDFGLAKQLGSNSDLSRSGAVLGTPSYMSPEQADGRGREIGPASDVYSLGAILYEMLTGRPPFRAETALDTMFQVVHHEPVPPRQLQPKVPLDLETVCLKCLEKEPRNRYASAAALADDLHRFVNDEPVLARPVSKWEQMHRWGQRNPLVAGLAGALLLVILLGLAVSWHFAWEAQARARDAEANEQLAIQQAAAAQAAFKQSLDFMNGVAGDLLEGSELPRMAALDPLRDKIKDQYLKLLEQHGHDPRVKREAAGIYLRLGRLEYATGKKDLALEHYRRALVIYGELARETPDEPTLRRRLVDVHLRRGMLLDDTDKVEAAQAEFTQALEQLRQLAQVSPGPEQKLLEAEVLHQRGVLHSRRSQWPAALAQYDQSLKSRQALFDTDPQHVQYRRDLARSHGYIGDVYMGLGDETRARKAYQASHELRWQLFEDNQKSPAVKDPDLKFQLARSFENTGNLYRKRGSRPEQAIRDYSQAKAYQQELVQYNSLVTDYQGDLGRTSNCLGALLTDLGRRDEAIKHLEQAHTVFKQLNEGDRRDASFLIGLAWSRAWLGKALFDDQPAAALELLSQARKNFDALPRVRLDSDSWYNRALVYALLAEHEANAMEKDPAARRERDEARRDYQARALEALGQAIEKGYANLEQFKSDRGLKDLRDRKEFQELVAALQKKLTPA